MSLVGNPLEDRYGSPAGAAAYRGKYRGGWTRRLTDLRERALIRWALRRLGGAASVLDVPCGAGRFAPLWREAGARAVLADLSPAMLEEARAQALPLVRAGADGLPFRDGAFDVVAVVRLLHHVAGRGERVAVFREAARVARRGVIVSFASTGTRKHRRAARRGRAAAAAAVGPEDLAREAGEAGLAVSGVRHLARFFSVLAVAALKKAY